MKMYCADHNKLHLMSDKIAKMSDLLSMIATISMSSIGYNYRAVLESNCIFIQKRAEA